MDDTPSFQIEIDGRKTGVGRGDTILDVAHRLAIHIPTLCHHKALSPYGACRICLVEVTQGNRTELKTSCNTLAQPGMSIKTDGEWVRKSRKVILELLLSRSPDSELIRALAKQFGIETTRFPLNKQTCILCGLCVRMCEERMGRSAISFANRGVKRAVVSPFGQKSLACQTCGACASICPTQCVDIEKITVNARKPIHSTFDAGLSFGSPVYISYPQAVPKLAAINKDLCVRLQKGACGVCEEFCEAGAIEYGQTGELRALEVGSVILTPGYEEFAAEGKGEFGYNRYANVMTSVQFERMLSASGPFEGHILRLSDRGRASRIAWIQCVGSRDATCGKEYCSSVCCMVATKQALVARDHQPGLEATIFYMDIRAYGKDFDQYYERATNEDSIHYIKSIPSRIIQLPGTNDLRLRFVDEEGKLKEQDFDLVILSVGMEPSPSVKESASRLGIDLNGFGFCATDRLRPLETSRPGVFVAGAFQEPKDIPETVTQASGAASTAMELLASVRNTLVTKKTYPGEHDTTDEEPRIGVFVCHCGINIASVVDVMQIATMSKSEPGVVLSTHSMFTCSDASLSEMKEKIHEYRLNRIVVASCTPRTHEPLFRETLREAGLNPYLFELANIRDQCSWVHSSNPREATEKAIDLVRMSIARARSLAPLGGESLASNQSGLVIGGGMSGMTAALSLAEQGFSINLIERSDHLGGNLLNVHSTLERDDIYGFTTGLIERVTTHPNIVVHLETDLAAVAGHIGNFLTTLTTKGEKIEVACGAIIVANGGQPAETSEYLYGISEHVLTQLELDKLLHEERFSASGGNVVMIQCVGSRNGDRPYCSRLCCSMAIKNALRLKEKDPDINIFVLYRDVRTYGFRETYYQKAREAGVVFIRYTLKSPPEVVQAGGLVVTLDSPDFPETIEIEADYVVLSTGILADGDNKRISNMLKVPLNTDGFYVEAHPKLRPVDFASEGIFLCGLAHAPKFIDENISQARAAAGRAATVLSKTHLEVGAQISHVDQQRCISCMTCVKACPYGAPFANRDHKAEIAGAKCMGCGICVAECPARAIQLNHFKTGQFNVMIDSLFQMESLS